MALTPQSDETLLNIYRCANCGGTFRKQVGPLLLSCAVRHMPGSCCHYAENEVAVEAFLARRIRFDQIHNVNVSTIDRLSFNSPASLDDLMALDREARDMARQSVQSITR